MPPGLVARPADTAQVAEVLRAAAAHGLTVVPRGRGTKMSWGTPPTSADVLLDVSALDQVLDHQAGDLIVAAQAGARLSDVQSVVAEAGQRLALDETVPGASIGGTLAANTSGPRRVATGTARDLLIGITVVRADGVVAKAGGRVVKNVAGYDLGKLMIGSFGHPGRHHRRHLPAAPAAGRAPLGERRGSRPGAGTGPRPVGAARPGRPGGDRGRLGRRARIRAACCSKAVRKVSPAAPRRSGPCSVTPRPSPPTRRPAGRRTPGTSAPRVTSARPLSS